MRVIISPIIAECEFWAVSETRRGGLPWFPCEDGPLLRSGLRSGKLLPRFPSVFIPSQPTRLSNRRRFLIDKMPRSFREQRYKRAEVVALVLDGLERHVGFPGGCVKTSSLQLGGLVANERQPSGDAYRYSV